MFLSFKVDGRTSRGKLVKTLFNDSGLASSDEPLQLNDVCRKCNNKAEEIESIECPICKELFHIPCLTHPIPTDLLPLKSTNPCLWWLCLQCVHKSQTESQQTQQPTPEMVTKSYSTAATSTEDENISNQVQLSNIITDLNATSQVQLSNFITESLTKFQNNILDSVDKKLGEVIPKTVASVPNATFADIVNNNSDKLSTILNKMPDSQTIQQLSDNVLNNNQNFSQKAGQTNPSACNEVLILSPGSPVDGKSSDAAKLLQKELSKNLKDVQVQFLKVNENNGKVIVGFPSRDEKTKGEKLINEVSQLSNKNYIMKSSAKMLPKLTIEYVPSEILDGINIPTSSNPADSRRLEKEWIVDLIKQKNPVVRQLVNDLHTLDVVYLNRNKTGRYLTIGIKVSPAIRSALLNAQGSRLFIGDSCYPFSDRY